MEGRHIYFNFSKTMKKKTIVLIIILVIILGLGISGYFGVKKAIQLGKEKGGEFLNELSEGAGNEKEQPAEESEGSYNKPIADATGRDLPDVPRYPGSVRSMYGIIPGMPDAGFYIMYDAPGSAKEVKDFYEAQLPANGWESSVTVKEAEEYLGSYRFIESKLTKGDQIMSISIGLGGSDYPGYTDVIITFPSDPFK